MTFLKIIRNFTAIFVIIFFISCKAHIDTGSNDFKSNKKDYISYFLLVGKAKNLYVSNEKQKSFQLLDSLFNVYKPLNTLAYDELELYCELALEFKKTNRLNEFVSMLVTDYGYDLGNSHDTLWTQIKKRIKYSDKDLKKKYSSFLKGINKPLRDSVVNIFKIDQEIRKTRNTFKIDSVDRINEIKTIAIIKKYGYPSVKLIGGHGKDQLLSQATMSVLLKHISYNRLKDILPILLTDIKNGNCPPMIYASALDVRKIVAKEQTDYEYFGTIKNVKPKDTLATNVAREAIGLSKIKY